MKTNAPGVKFMALCLTLLSFFLLNACSLDSNESVQPEVNANHQLQSRSIGNQLASAVKGKVAAYYSTQLSSVTACYFEKTSAEGYFQYHFQISGGPSGIYMVTNIIGGDVEGFFF